MFQYEYEKRPPSSMSCESRATATTEWSRTFPSLPEHERPATLERAERGAYQCEQSERRAYDSEQSERRAYESEQGRGGAYQDEQTQRQAYQSEQAQKRAYQCEQTQKGAYQSEQTQKGAYQSGHGVYPREQKGYPSGYEGYRTRPLPPRPVCERVPTKSSVPLKVWVIASASCFSVCAVLVLATVVITRWGAGPTYTREMVEEPELIYSNPHPIFLSPKQNPTTTESDITEEIDNEIDLPVIEKLSIFKNTVVAREKTKKTEDLISKSQLHPIHDPMVEHIERKIEKKDQPKMPSVVELVGVATNNVRRPIEDFNEVRRPIDDFNGFKRPKDDFNEVKRPIPDFKPTLPDVFIHSHGEIKLPDGYMVGLRKQDEYEDYYNDENLYDDYMQSNTMTNYLIEKVQELHDWITSDPDFETVKNSSKIANKGAEFSVVLKALNESLVQGNVSIIMSKLKDIYFGDNYTSSNHSRRMIVSNSTDLLSFGILTLDIMLLHNIQLMAWENQEALRTKMLKDPNVFAFNALFMDPSKVEAKQNEVLHHHDTQNTFSKRQNLRQDMDNFDIGKSLLENFLEVGMSTARAAIHLGRAYKNTKAVLSQLQNREAINSNIQAQMSRNMEENTVALNHLQNSYQGVSNTAPYTDLDCVWLLYCRNLDAAGKLNAPYGTMARINGMALRILVGELPTDKALEAMVFEAFTGWTELKCDEMFPRCSKVDAPSVVMETILQPVRKAQGRS